MYIDDWDCITIIIIGSKSAEARGGRGRARALGAMKIVERSDAFSQAWAGPRAPPRAI